MVAQSSIRVADNNMPASIKRRLLRNTLESEADTILRDLAFILHLTQQVGDEIREEQGLAESR
jgi:hypothetical protein